MYRCDPCNINYTSTRKLFSHQLSPEHIKKLRSLNKNHVHSIPQQFSNRRIGRVDVGGAGGGLEIGRETGSRTAVSANQSGTTTHNYNTHGSETAGPSTSMNINRATRPQQQLNQSSTGSRGSNIISQSNLSVLADGAKGAMRKNPGTSGAKGGKFNGRRASIVTPNRQRTTGAQTINHRAAPAAPKLGILKHRRVSTISRKPDQKVMRNVRQRNERAKSIQRKIEPEGSGTVRGNKRVAGIPQQAHLPKVSVPSAVVNSKETTKSFNKQQLKQSPNLRKISLSQEVSNRSIIPPSNPIKLEKKKEEMNIKQAQTEKVEPQQKEKVCGVRERLLLPPKKSAQLVAPAKAEGGGKGGRAPPKKNVERYNRFISIPLSPIKLEGVPPYQLSGEVVVPPTSSAMTTNTKSGATVTTASVTGRGGHVVTSAAASSCKAREGSFKATSQNANRNLDNGLNPIEHSSSAKSREGAESSSDRPSKSVSVVVVPTTSSATRSSKKSTADAATSTALRGGRVATKDSAAQAPSEARILPGNAFHQKKNRKSVNSFQVIQPSEEKRNGAQSSQKGKSTKLPPGVVPCLSSDTANLPGKKKADIAIVSAALGTAAAKAVETRKSSKTRGVGGRAPPQQKNRNFFNRFNQIQASSKQDKGVSISPNGQSTKRPPGIVSWLQAADRGSEVVVDTSTVTKIAQPKLAKVRKGARKVTLKQLKEYVPTMPGTDYKMPLLTAIGSYTNKQGNKLWICLVCNKTEPMKSSKPMVCCEICDDWYHFKCVGIKKKMPRKDPWFCKRCIFRPSEKKKLKNV